MICNREVNGKSAWSTLANIMTTALEDDIIKDSYLNELSRISKFVDDGCFPAQPSVKVSHTLQFFVQLATQFYTYKRC